ncbi:octapeptide-repeat protein T2-like isoform X3 [Dermacentor silvarum]|uniref:octapeptide-repeat protein T2-like isoform X3 n=1 Tax=Dermacentor silvarum TaxID=543639 RepID=UPI00210117F6|nr:octapeptide-repeat protein T2-like isoform X3 [Dermacentor silvarum]
MDAVPSASAQGSSAGDNGASTSTGANNSRVFVGVAGARPVGGPRNTEAGNAEAKARHDEVMQRKRPDNAELRAGEVEAKRQRRAAELRAKKAEAMRRKRRENADFRAREAEVKRQRRAADPELRAREAEALRRRRRENAELRARDVEANRQRRAADPELRAREAEAMRRKRREKAELRAREAEANRQRRAADPELRARSAEAKRRKRREEAELRARELESTMDHIHDVNQAVDDAHSTQHTCTRTKLTSAIRQRKPRRDCHNKYVGEDDPLPREAHQSCQTEHHITLVWCARPNVSTCSTGVQVEPWEQQH